MITFARPNRTFLHVGQPPTATHETQGPFNYPFDKPRKGQFQRYRDGPALIHKLGHYGYVCKEFQTELEFYTGNFNFYTDHHTFFLQRAPSTVRKTYVHHTTFEVADFDTQLMGHHYLAKKGWKSVWGVWRHILGSQIFDYWYDSSKSKIEHYADGDVVNRDNPTRREPVGPLSVWGPELPSDFWEQ
ncbi:Glyoxalase/Bleomycin resistance protein/Dihydroxybiphenyl dioxygenase [Aspergillus tetrazonus]